MQKNKNYQLDEKVGFPALAKMHKKRLSKIKAIQWRKKVL